jgi:predicted glutamine amidotransferase
MCGIFGFSANKKITEEDILKFNILGLFNESRGVHSCGIFDGDRVVRGVDDNKLYKNFIVNNPIIPSETNNILIGHCRQASVGAHTIENCHPFEVGELTIVHNGTIKDTYSLGNKYGLKFNDYGIDSHLLCKLIESDGFEILNEYIGTAALIFTYRDEPNDLYIYHGASKLKESDKDIVEERPLFALKTENGIFISSMKNSLEFINNNKEEKIQVVPYNKVIKLSNGKLNEVCYEVNRKTQEVTYAQATIPVYKNKSKSNENWRDFVLYKDGRYYNNKNNLMNGVTYLDSDGNIYYSYKHSLIERHFYMGILLKYRVDILKLNNITYSCRNKDKPKSLAKELSVYSLYPIKDNVNDCVPFIKETKDKWFFNGIQIKDLSFQPLYHDKQIKINDGISLVEKPKYVYEYDYSDEYVDKEIDVGTDDYTNEETSTLLDTNFDSYEDFLLKTTITEQSVIRELIYNNQKELFTYEQVNDELKEILKDCYTYGITLRDHLTVKDINDVIDLMSMHEGDSDYEFIIDEGIDDEFQYIIDSLDDFTNAIQILPDNILNVINTNLNIIKKDLYSFIDNKEKLEV